MMRIKKVSALWLLALVMAVVLVASGPVAELLDLSESTAQAKKKHKKKHRVYYNPVQCSTDPCFGTNANDAIAGTNNSESILALQGSDLVYGLDDNDNIAGDDGNLNRTSTPGPETLTDGNDWLDGGPASDTLYAYGGSDVLLGGDGDDFILANESSQRPGNDYVSGGPGNDTILFTQDGAFDYIDCGEGTSDTVSNHEAGDFVASNCENVS